MKKITLLTALMITSLGFAQDLEPAVGAPNPPARNAWDVISIFNGNGTSPVNPAYTDVPGVDFKNFGGGSFEVPFVLADGNTVVRYFDHLYSGISVAAGDGLRDVSAMTMLHMDVWSPDFTGFAVKLESGENKVAKERAVTPSVKGVWNSIDIDLQLFVFGTDVDLTQLKFMLPVTYQDPARNLFIDNVYFYRAATTLGVSKFDASGIKMYPNPIKNTLTIEAKSEIQRVSVYNVLGQEVMSTSPKSNATTLQTSELQKGVYMVKTEINGNVSTSKIIKE